MFSLFHASHKDLNSIGFISFPFGVIGDVLAKIIARINSIATCKAIYLSYNNVINILYML